MTTTPSSHSRHPVWTRYCSAVASGAIADALACFSSVAPVVVCVPTAAGADGSASSLAKFIKLMIDQQSFMSIEERILSVTLSASQLAQESILTFVHDSPLDWILPNVKPTRKRVVIPLVCIACFASDETIQTLRMYWDQASVLRQIGVLPNSLYCKANSSETVLPVLGPRIVDRLNEPYNVPVQAVVVNSSAPESVAAANKRNNQNSDIFAPPTPKATGVRASTAMADILNGVPERSAMDQLPVNRPIHRSSSDIFGTNPEPAQQIPIAAEKVETSTGVDSVTGSRPSSRVIHRPGGPSSNIFGNDDEPVGRKSSRRDPNWSSLDAHTEQPSNDINGAVDPVTGGRPSSKVIHRPGGPSSNIFNNDEEPIGKKSGRRDPNWSSQENVGNDTSDHVTGARPSSRVIHRPGGPSSDIFGIDDMPVGRKPSRRDPNWSSLDQIESKPEDSSTDAVTGARPSSRVIHRPGGPSSNIFGVEGESAPTQEVVHMSRGAYHNFNETSYEAEVRKAHEKGEGEYAAPEKKYGRKMSAHAYDTSIFLGDDSNAGKSMAASGGTVGGMAGAGSRDRNAMGESGNDKQSSRALGPPWRRN
ncbi:hypothetical protein HDU84_003007 [Entophlyctis sp. JEL0112]|nr:hypothetical protein HDU84_003007 [Entophlyctis sp. JEL0112]